MSTVLLLQPPDATRDARAAALEAAGCRVVCAAPEWAELRGTLDAYAFDALVVDCAVKPSHSRECAKYLAERKATRALPLLLVDVKPADRVKTAVKLPSARLVAGEELVGAVAALGGGAAGAARPKADPVAAFRKRFDLAGDGWALVGTGEEFRATLERALGALWEDGAARGRLLSRSAKVAPRTVRTAMVELTDDTRDLGAFFRGWQGRLEPDGALWVISPKNAKSRARTWNDLQEAALTTDLVDTKIAAFSATLTATRFVIRKERRKGR